MGGGAPSHTPTLTNQQRLVSTKLGKTILNGIDQPNQVYKGNTVAPLDGGYQDLYNQLRTYMATTGGLNSPLQQQSNSALSDLLGGKPAFELNPDITKKWYTDSVITPMMNTYNEQVKPQIEQAFAAGGRTFSALKGATLGRTLNDMNIAAGAQLGQVQLSNQNLEAQLAQNAKNLQLQTAQALPGIESQNLSNSGALEQLLQPFQTYQQNILNQKYQRWQASQKYNSPWMALSQQYLSNPQTALYTPQSTLSQISQGIGTAGSAVGAGANAAIIANLLSSGGGAAVSASTIAALDAGEAGLAAAGLGTAGAFGGGALVGSTLAGAGASVGAFAGGTAAAAGGAAAASAGAEGIGAGIAALLPALFAL